MHQRLTRKRCSKRPHTAPWVRTLAHETAPHILVIDDSLTSRTLLKNILEAEATKLTLP